MQVIPPDQLIPVRLLCGGCRHWEESAIHALTDTSERTGRCARFSETRSALSRPRCNICWEPAMSCPEFEVPCCSEGSRREQVDSE